MERGECVSFLVAAASFYQSVAAAAAAAAAAEALFPDLTLPTHQLDRMDGWRCMRARHRWQLIHTL